MKNIGITREVDGAGRIVLPMELRRNMGIEDGTPLEISVDGGNIVLSPVARPLTIEQLEKRKSKPVYAVNKRGEKKSLWIIIEEIYRCNGMLIIRGINFGDRVLAEYDFYDREVPRR